MKTDSFVYLATLKARADALERKIAEMERREAATLAIVNHMRKHRVQTYFRSGQGVRPAYL